MKKKTLIGIALAMALALALCFGAAVYAAGGSFTMTYLPGTSDTVTNMPAADSGVGGQPYSVSGTIPQREGYEFIGWTLDYGLAKTYSLNYVVKGDPTYGVPGDTAAPAPVTGIPAGGNVTLTSPLSTAWKTKDGSPAPTTASYTVHYLNQDTKKQLAEDKTAPGVLVGTTVTEPALSIFGYKVIGGGSQDLTVKPNVEGRWTFTGWCSDEACTKPVTEVTNITADTTVYGKWLYSETANTNEITFYYEVKYVDYTVEYLCIAGDTCSWRGEHFDDLNLFKPKTVYRVPEGSTVKEYFLSKVGGHCSAIPESNFHSTLNTYKDGNGEYVTETARDGLIIIFLYYPVG